MPLLCPVSAACLTALTVVLTNRPQPTICQPSLSSFHLFTQPWSPGWLATSLSGDRCLPCRAGGPTYHQAMTRHLAVAVHLPCLFTQPWSPGWFFASVSGVCNDATCLTELEAPLTITSWPTTCYSVTSQPMSGSHLAACSCFTTQL